ncbi:MAG TPA: DUF1924 domain-containing protein [Gallionella sp.]|nr:DUF1924 domain-containing protein [Gallionella sp.]
MFHVLYASGLALVAVAGLAAQPAFAETPDEILASIQKEASATPGFQGFSAVRGESFFKTKHGREWSCASCHTDNSAAPGKHAKTGKAIEPLAPSANVERFANPKKVEKWFKRNCNDVLNRECTPQEKGDVLAYLLTIKK